MKNPFKAIFLTALLALFYTACNSDDTGQLYQVEDEETEIELHFYQNDTETKQEFETGLKWGFSYLGASLEKGSWSRGTRWIQSSVFLVNLEEIGFNEKALASLRSLIKQFKESEEYLKTGAIDAGRFMVCILNNPNHYYKITNVPNTLNQFTADYSFLQKRAAIIESAVAFKERIIRMSASSQSVSNLGYWAEELSGSLKDSTHRVIENEVMDIMPNGQLRFAVYDTLNQLIEGADPTLTLAGKPIKCLWCHEVNIQRGFAALTKIPGYYAPNEFDSIVAENALTLTSYRAALNSEIDFTDKSQHTEIEKLYIRYFEPSAKRLAAEWSISEQEVITKLSSFTTHTQSEFPEFGELYFRADIQRFSPYSVLPSSSSQRETNENEPNLLP